MAADRFDSTQLGFISDQTLWKGLQSAADEDPGLDSDKNRKLENNYHLR